MLTSSNIPRDIYKSHSLWQDHFIFVSAGPGTIVRPYFNVHWHEIPSLHLQGLPPSPHYTCDWCGLHIFTLRKREHEWLPTENKNKKRWGRQEVNISLLTKKYNNNLTWQDITNTTLCIQTLNTGGPMPAANS